MRVGSRQINGVDTEIHANPDGMFHIQIEGKSIGSGETLDAAVVQARNTINRDKTVVNVPFITKDGGERGVARGFHSRNRSTLVEIAGKKSAMDYQSKAFRADIPPAKLNRWFEIKQQMDALREEQNGLIRDYEITLREKVQQAINDAQSKTLSGVVAKKAAERATSKPVAGSRRRRRY